MCRCFPQALRRNRTQFLNSDLEGIQQLTLSPTTGSPPSAGTLLTPPPPPSLAPSSRPRLTFPDGVIPPGLRSRPEDSSGASSAQVEALRPHHLRPGREAARPAPAQASPAQPSSSPRSASGAAELPQRVRAGGGQTLSRRRSRPGSEASALTCVRVREPPAPRPLSARRAPRSPGSEDSSAVALAAAMPVLRDGKRQEPNPAESAPARLGLGARALPAAHRPAHSPRWVPPRLSVGDAPP